MKKENKKVLIILILVIIAYFIGVNNLEYILNGNSVEEIVYRAGKVIKSGDINQNVEQEKDIDIYTNGGDLKVYFFNVGQADCIFITNSGESMIIDAGNNSDGKNIVNQLKDMNITKIDYVVGTHAHEDHIGGLDNILNNFSIGKVLMPKKSTTTKSYEDVLKAVKNKKLKITAPNIGDVFYLGGAKCEIKNVDHNTDDLNETSIVIEMTYGERKFLFTGDTETTKEKEISWNDIDVLKVAHHGSSSSTSNDFLDESKPEYAVISCGLNNDYGHPHKEVVKRLNGIETYRTDQDGTILITCDGKNLEFEKLNIDLDGNEK